MTSAFPLASSKQLGYRIEQVDAFLERAREAYERDDAEAPAVTSAEVRNTAFKLQRKGYSARFVDAAMDRLEEVFFARERSHHIEQFGEESWWAEAQQLLREVRGRLERPRGERFKRRGFFASGYHRAEVDAFLDRVTLMLAGEQPLTTGEVRGAVFHSQLRGYDEDQVDAFLDAVVQLMLTVK